MTRIAAGWILAFTACGGGGHSTGDAPSGDSHAIDAGTSDAGCARVAAPVDRVRQVVISHPYDAASNEANAWEVLDLSTAGVLTRPKRTFTMGRATGGVMAFTPDGEIGAVSQEDGSLGVVKLASDGTPTVIAAAFTGSFYATGVAVAPSGDRVYVLDGNTRDNGGGIYAVDIACDGSVTDAGLVAAAKLPGGLAFVPGGDHAVVAAGDFLTSTAGDSAHLVTLGAAPTWIGGANAFGDDMAIVGGSTLTSDAGHFLIGDISQFSGIPNRVAVVSVSSAAVAAVNVIANVGDPEAIVASPFGDVALVTDGFGNAFHVLDDTGTGWKLRGDVTYVGAAPQLPAGAVEIAVGALSGTALVAENLGVRIATFGHDGAVTDHGAFALGSGTENITGAIGVTP